MTISLGKPYVGFDTSSLNRPAAATATAIDKWLSHIARPDASRPEVPTKLTPTAGKTDALEERLFDAAAGFKVFYSQVSMHLDADWRRKLFMHIDRVLNADDWDPRDLPPLQTSFQTLIRLLLLLRPERKPGLGADHEGNLIAAWTVGPNRLTVICLPNDRVRWVLSRQLEEPMRAAGENGIGAMKQVLSPWAPEVWLSYA